MKESKKLTIDEVSEALLSVRSTLVKGDTSVEKELDLILEACLNIDFIEGEIKCYEYLGGVYRMKGDYKKALGVYKKGYALALQHNDTKMLPIMINWLGSAYFFLGDYKKSFDLASESLVLFDKLGMYEKKSEVLINLGQRHNAIGNLKKAEQYLLQGIDVAKDLEDDSQTWANYFSLAQYYNDVNEDEKCRINIDKSLELAQRFDSQAGICFSLEKKGALLSKEGKFKEALTYLDEALVVAEKNKIASSVLGINIIRSSCFLNIGDLKEAEKLLSEVIKDKRTEKAKLSMAHKYLYELNMKNKDFESAIFNLSTHMKLEGELQSVETQKHIETTEAKYQNELKEKEKEILRLQKVEMEQKAIRAQLNPHFFFNALNSIQNFILDNDKENATRYLRSFSGLMRKTLENSEEMFITIEDEIEFLKDYLSIEQMRLNKSFTFHFEVEEELEEDFVKIPTMLLQPYIENCIKHGVNGIENGKIVVRFSQENEENVLCVIEDNGRGRAIKKEQEHRSMGTKLLEERILALKNQFNVDFSISIIDLKDKLNKPTGTRVEINLPSNLNILLKA